MSGLGDEWSKVLTPREREILLLVGRGWSNKDVARELGLRPGTVKIHVHSIFVKLGERNRAGLVILTQSSSAA
jgi:DNA-binding NarL/FixJ family response regulator